MFKKQLHIVMALIGVLLMAFVTGLITLPQLSIGGSLAVVGLTFMQNDDVIKYLINIGFLDAGGGLKALIKAKTANYAIVTGTDPSGTLFTNRGAAGTIVFTLPAPAQNLAGTFYDFLTAAAQIITVATATADTLIADNDATADSLSTTARLGVTMRLVCDGTSWIATLTSGVPQAAFAQTGTVAT